MPFDSSNGISSVDPLNISQKVMPSKVLSLLVSIIILGLLGTCTLLAYRNNKLSQQISQSVNTTDTQSISTPSPMPTQEVSPQSEFLLEQACDFNFTLPNGYSKASDEKDSNNTCMVINGTDPVGEYVPYIPKKLTIKVYLSSQKGIEGFLKADEPVGINFNRGSTYFRRDELGNAKNDVLLYERTNERTKYLRASYGGEEHVILVDKGQLIYEIFYKYDQSNKDVDGLAENLAKQLKSL